MHNLEVQRIKVQSEGRFNIQKQRCLLSSDPANDRDISFITKECEKLRLEVDELREQRESEVDTIRTRMEDEYRANVRLMKQEAYQTRERQEAKLLRVYSQKAQESRIVIGHHHDEEMDKKQQYVREMKEKMLAKLNF